jgi:hypothetical protein
MSSKKDKTPTSNEAALNNVTGRLNNSAGQLGDAGTNLREVTGRITAKIATLQQQAQSPKPTPAEDLEDLSDELQALDEAARNIEAAATAIGAVGQALGSIGDPNAPVSAPPASPTPATQETGPGGTATPSGEIFRTQETPVSGAVENQSATGMRPEDLGQRQPNEVTLGQNSSTGSSAEREGIFVGDLTSPTDPQPSPPETQVPGAGMSQDTAASQTNRTAEANITDAGQAANTESGGSSDR